MSRRTAALIVTGLLGMSACQSTDLGSGVDTVDRDFAKPLDDVWSASVKAVDSMSLKMASDRHDRFGGELVAYRATGDQVRVWVRSLDENRTQVSVRVEPGDKALAGLLQERIAERLGLGEAQSDLLGGDSVEAVYPMDLPPSMRIARRVFRSLEIAALEEEAHADWARIDGRLKKDATPVRIRAERFGKDRVRVTFIYGSEKSADNRPFCHRMQEEFESAARPEASGSLAPARLRREMAQDGRKRPTDGRRADRPAGRGRAPSGEVRRASSG